MEASIAVEKSIHDLARRVTETEFKIGTVTQSRDSGDAVASVNAHIDALRTELEKLTNEHQKISVEVGEVSASVKSLSEAAGRIGPIGDTVEHLNDAILALRKDMPEFAAVAAGRAGKEAAQAMQNTGTTELAEKLSAVQNLLLTQLRENQEADGRSFGALESIRGLVQKLHHRIDALDTDEAPQQAAAAYPALPPQQAARLAPHVQHEPDFVEDVMMDEPPIAIAPQPAPVAAMSREQLIASARRAAIAASQRPGSGPAPAAAQPAVPEVAMPSLVPSKASWIGSHLLLTGAMIAVLSVGLGIGYLKFRKPAAPAVIIEQTALPDFPDDAADPMPAGKSGKDAGKPGAAAAATKAPAKTSAMTPDGQGMAAANAGELPPAVAAKPAVVASMEPAASASVLPAAIAPLSIRNAAESGDPAAAYTVAERFLSGRDVPRDAAKAKTWYEQSAKAGYPLAEFHLGLMFERGDDGLAADRAQALAWYKKGAEHGNVQAMHNLAVLHTAQSGGAPDYVPAAKWFGEAANFGLKDSQFNLAVLYQNGLGVPKDAGLAYKWFAIGAAHGDSEAAKQRDELVKTLTPPALAAANAEVKAWHQKLIDHRANYGDLPGTAAIPAGATPMASMAASASTEVGDVQKMLAKLGYDPGAQDGTLSAQTREAIKTFEQRSGMKTDGEISDELIGKLKALAG